MDTSKLDPESRMQMRIIALETAEARNLAVYKAQGDLEKMILALEDRVKILEEARKIQIQLNESIQKVLAELGKPPKVEMPKVEEKPKWKFW